MKLYGHILDLENERILAEPDKLAALRSKPIPKNITMLKSFWSALTFMGSLLPIAGRALAVIHIATRGKTLTWGNEQQKSHLGARSTAASFTHLMSFSRLIKINKIDQSHITSKPGPPGIRHKSQK